VTQQNTQETPKTVSQEDFRRAESGWQTKHAEERKGRQDAEKLLRQRDSELTTAREDFEEFKKGNPTEDERVQFRAEQRDLRKERQNVAEQQTEAQGTMLDARKAQIKAKHPSVTDEILESLSLGDLKGFEAALSVTATVETKADEKIEEKPADGKAPLNDRTDTPGAEGGILSDGRLSSQQLREVGMKDKREREEALRENLSGGA
jgi:hypothetical protein